MSMREPAGGGGGGNVKPLLFGKMMGTRPVSSGFNEKRPGVGKIGPDGRDRFGLGIRLNGEGKVRVGLPMEAGGNGSGHAVLFTFAELLEGFGLFRFVAELVSVDDIAICIADDEGEVDDEGFGLVLFGKTTVLLLPPLSSLSVFSVVNVS